MNTRLQSHQPSSGLSLVPPLHTSLLQRKCACGGSAGLDGECEECRNKRLQRRSANGTESTTVPPIVHEVLRSPGQPLDPQMRAFFESRFGHDFSKVRVHTDTRAAESAKAVNARAYTVGRDMVFNASQYTPTTSNGRKLLAHELSHVVQQSRVSEYGYLEIGDLNSPQEHEASTIAEQPMTQSSVPKRTTIPLTSVSAGTIQRGDPPLPGAGEEITPEARYGSVFLRLNDKGRVEVLYGTPRLPLAGSIGIGFRCEGGRCQPVGSQDPADISHRTYTFDEAIDRLTNGHGGTTPGQIPLGCPIEEQTPYGTCCPDRQMWIDNECRTMPLPTLPRVARELPMITLYFFFDNAILRPESNGHFRQVVSLMQNISTLHIQLTGHSSMEGTEEYNLRLSRQRADVMRDTLVREGIDASRIQTQGFGEFAPAEREPETSENVLLPALESVRNLNRRVEVVFFDPTGTHGPTSPPMFLRTLELRLPSLRTTEQPSLGIPRLNF